MPLSQPAPRYSVRFSLCFLTLLSVAAPHPALAQDTDASNTKQETDTMTITTQQRIDTLTTLIKAVIQAIKDMGDTPAKAITAASAQTTKENLTPNEDATLEDSLMELPAGNALTEMITATVMEGRLRELSLIVPKDKDGKEIDVKDYLVKPTGDSLSVNAQIFDIFLRYFCDPSARIGDTTMGEFLVAQNVNVASVKYPDKLLSCGSVRSPGGGRTEDPARDSLVPGTDAAAAYQRGQIVNLPLRPSVLFFDPVTLPTVAPGYSNDNPLAESYYGAVQQSMHFLAGMPPEKPNLGNINTPAERARYIESQAKIARQMLLSYPFAVLFSERVGTMTQNVAQSMADMLLERLVRSEDKKLYERIENLAKRSNFSVAEYMDIAMYQTPMSPGYLARINQMTPSQLQREKVWLTAMQTALSYQRNRWLEISAAVEAVR